MFEIDNHKNFEDEAQVEFRNKKFAKRWRSNLKIVIRTKLLSDYWGTSISDLCKILEDRTKFIGIISVGSGKPVVCTNKCQ